MRVGAANNVAVNHSLDVEVSPVLRPPGNLVEAIGADRAGAHIFEFCFDMRRHGLISLS